jgi:formyltetrahydrofolate deformylase
MSATLLVNSPDEVGLIHRITGIFLRKNLNIISNAEYVDSESSWFFMRTVFEGNFSGKELLDEVQRILPPRAHARLASDSPKRIVLFAGKEPYCLGELLLRVWNSELNAQIEAVVSNHPDVERLVRKFDLPFHFVPVGGSERSAHESKICRLIETLRPDYLVLAKYMRILSAAFITSFPGRIINIHHSFLPAFVGAGPYKQAYDRGVKIIGATAHFVNENLDDGPIIAQSILPVTHADSAASMARQGREIEKLVLARALQLVLEDRVFVHGNRTVIFE